MISIVWEDPYLIVVQKPVDVLSEPIPGEDDILTLVSSQIRRPVLLVHRLDRSTGGLMVLAKTREAASKLSVLIQENKFQKEYLAVIHGVPEKISDTWEDLLFKDSAQNKSYVVKRERVGVRKAKLSYTLLRANAEKTCSLVRIRLETGRTHQIRVQFSYRNMPLLGDGKYGSRDNRCSTALWSSYLSFSHPVTGEKLDFSSFPPNCYPWNQFSVK